MVEERLVKTHLVVTDVHEQYIVKWFGKIKDAKPLIKNGKPIFVIIGDHRRMELNTTDMQQIEKCAKSMTNPRGRAAFTTDKSRIYIKEVDGHEKYLGAVIHNHIKTYAPMYDKVGYR